MKKSTLGKTLCVLAVGFFCLNSKGQNEEENLKKYWNYRDRYLKQFVKIGSNEGDGLNCINIDDQPLNESANVGANAFPTTNPQYGYRKWADVPANQGNYLAVLATQARLQSDANIDNTAVLNELYYAILAIERIDGYAERFIDPQQNSNYNGFFIRDDVRNTVTQEWISQYPITEDPRDRYEAVTSGYYNDMYPVKNLAQRCDNEMSQDQLFGILQGFVFVKKFVGHVFVRPTSLDVGFFIDDKIKQITERYMTHLTAMHSRIEEYSIVKIDNNQLPLGWNSGSFPPLGPVVGFPGSTDTISNVCNVNENWIVFNPVINDVCGSFNQKQKSEIRPFAYPVAKIAELITGNDYTSLFGNSAYRFKKNSQDILGDGNYCLPYNINLPLDDLNGNHWQLLQYASEILTPNSLAGETPSLCINITNDTIFLPFGNEIKPLMLCFPNYNTYMALQLATLSGTWQQSKINQIAQNWNMPLFDIMYAALNNSSPSLPQSYWKGFLDSAPCQGPYNYKNPYTGIVERDNNWFAPFKWDGEGVSDVNSHGEFNGNDYMLLYNLYQLIYKSSNQLPSYKENTCPCNESKEVSQKIKNHSTVLSNGEYLLNNNTVVGRKFTDYMTFGIKLKEFSINNLQIPSAKQLDVQTDLVVCNNSTMKIKNGGKIVVGDAASPQSSIIVRSGSTLHIEGNGRLTINDNCKIIIEKGATLVYDAGAIIQLLGNDAVLEIQGDLVLGNTAVFKFTYPNSTSGYVKFSDPDFAQAPYDQIRTVSPGQTASVELRGANKNDKILEVAQDLLQVAIGNGITTFKVEYGLVDFTYNNGVTYISSDANVRFYNSKFTKTPSIPSSSTQPSNVAVWGQAQCQIAACEFSPNVGLIGNLFAYGNKLTVTGTLAYGGIRTQGAGLTLNSVTTSSLTSELMSFNSIATNSKFIYGEGASIISSPVEFDFNSCRANNNYFSGYRVDGPTLLKVKCGQVKTNQYTGFHLANNASLSMNVTDNGGYVDARDNAVNTILLDNAHSIDIENGYNDLRPYDFYSVTSSQTSSSACVNFANCGYVVIEGSIQQMPTNPILSDNNRWQLSTSNTLFPLQAANGKDKYTRVSSTYSLPGSNDVRFVASSQSPIVACDYWNTSCTTCPKSYLEICPTCHVINTDDFTNVKTNEAVKSAITKLETASIDTTANKESVDMLYQVLQYPLPVANDGDKYVKSIAEKKILVALANGIEKSEIKVSEQQLSPEVMKVLEVVDSKILKAQADNNYDHLQNAVYEKALLYYSSKHRTDALSTLNQYLPSIQPKDLDRFNRLVCQITSEQQLLNGEISQYDYLRSIENCVPIQKREVARRTLTIPSEESDEIETLAVQVYPNPAEDQLNVQFSQVLLADALFSIYDLTGKLVFSTQLKAGTDKSEIIGFDLSNGMYIYKVDSGGEILHQGKLSIIK
ncbi:MAG: T9SS type A sorting domain-containing protein [Bacteroidia bacterium]|nr:T9SS type A sorting domain-containing protein [Bacteroidia bacterium]